jgi:hypothetical protein
VIEVSHDPIDDRKIIVNSFRPNQLKSGNLHVLLNDLVALVLDDGMVAEERVESLVLLHPHFQG